MNKYRNSKRQQKRPDTRFNEDIKKWYNMKDKYNDHWKDINKLTTLCLVYLALKYKSCLPSHVLNTYNQTIISIRDNMDSDKETNDLVVKKIAECIIKNPKKSFVVFVLLKDLGHANLLIYNASANTIEHFEPHGYDEDYMVEELLWVTNEIKEIIDDMNKNYFTPETEVKFITSEQGCPKNFSLQMDDYFCAAWSIMVAELHLKYPTYDLKTIHVMIKNILSRLEPTYDPNEHNINLIKGYVVNVFENIQDYVGFAIGQKINPTTMSDFDVENILAMYTSNDELLDRRYPTSFKDNFFKARYYGDNNILNRRDNKDRKLKQKYDRMKMYKSRNINTHSKTRSVPTKLSKKSTLKTKYRESTTI